jgi:hypothetical protein
MVIMLFATQQEIFKLTPIESLWVVQQNLDVSLLNSITDMLQLSLNVCEHESVGFGKCSS